MCPFDDRSSRACVRRGARAAFDIAVGTQRAWKWPVDGRTRTFSLGPAVCRASTGSRIVQKGKWCVTGRRYRLLRRIGPSTADLKIHVGGSAVTRPSASCASPRRVRREGDPGPPRAERGGRARLLINRVVRKRRHGYATAITRRAIAAAPAPLPPDSAPPCAAAPSRRTAAAMPPRRLSHRHAERAAPTRLRRPLTLTRRAAPAGDSRVVALASSKTTVAHRRRVGAGSPRRSPAVEPGVPRGVGQRGSRCPARGARTAGRRSYTRGAERRRRSP